MTLARPHKVSSFCVGVAAAGAAYLSTKVTRLDCAGPIGKPACTAPCTRKATRTPVTVQHMVWSRVASSQQHRGARQSEVPQVRLLDHPFNCHKATVPAVSQTLRQQALQNVALLMS